MNPICRVWIPGEPKGNPRHRTARLRSGAIRSYQDPRAVAWKTQAGVLMEAAYEGPVLSGPIGLRIWSWRSCPRSSWRKTKPVPEQWTTKKPDVDNIAKLLMDAAIGILYLDDSQVALLEVATLQAEQGSPAGVRLEAFDLSNSDHREVPQWPGSSS